LAVNQEFEQCLESRKIVSFARGKKLVKKELLVAKSDLADARAGHGNERYKWVNYSGILCDVPRRPGACLLPGLP
jgi:hypothetical protein